MENKATELYVLLAVPLDVLEEAEIDLTGVIQFTVVDGKIVIENVDDPSDFPCAGMCESCVLREGHCPFAEDE